MFSPLQMAAFRTREQVMPCDLERKTFHWMLCYKLGLDSVVPALSSQVGHGNRKPALGAHNVFVQLTVTESLLKMIYCKLWQRLILPCLHCMKNINIIKISAVVVHVFDYLLVIYSSFPVYLVPHYYLQEKELILRA